MPRLYDDVARAARDAQLLRLYLAGHSYREMAAQPGVGLSLRGVVKAVRRQLATGVDAVLVSELMAISYARACKNDENDQRGQVALRRIIKAQNECDGGLDVEN